MIQREDTLSFILTDEQRKRLTNVLEQCLKWLDEGAPPDLDRLIDEHPDLALALRHYIPRKVLDASKVSRKTKAAGINSADPNAIGHGPKAAEPPKRRDAEASQPHPKQLGDFALEQEIGRGGMGIVFKAKQISLDRIVAVKILPIAATWDCKQVARFQNEAQAAAQLNHPNIVSVHSVGKEWDTYYYSMPFIDGISLEKVVRKLRTDPEIRFEFYVPVDRSEFPSDPATGKDKAERATRIRKLFEPPKKDPASSKSPKRPLNKHQIRTPKNAQNLGHVRAVVEMVAQAAEALHYAHQQGIIHRDIKPSNLMLDRQGKLWITDFGLAMISGNAGLTGPGDVLGTLKYMSPEQSSGKSHWIDERSDVYSLGVTLYELLTLYPVVDGEDRLAMLKQIKLHGPVSARKRNPAISKMLENVLLKAISKYPEDRYASAQLFANDLRLFLANGKTLANRPGIYMSLCRAVRRNPQWTVMASGALLMMVAGLIPFSYWLLLQKASCEQRFVQTQAELDNASIALDRLGLPLLQQLQLQPGTESLQKQLGQEQAVFLRSFLDFTSRDPRYQSQRGVLLLQLAKWNSLSITEEESLFEYQRIEEELGAALVRRAPDANPTAWLIAHHELASHRIQLGRLEQAMKDLKQVLSSIDDNSSRIASIEESKLKRLAAILRLDLSFALAMRDSVTAAARELNQALSLIQAANVPAQPSDEKSAENLAVENGDRQPEWCDIHIAQSLVLMLLQNSNQACTEPDVAHRLNEAALAIANSRQNPAASNLADEHLTNRCFLALGLSAHRLGLHQEAIQWFRNAMRSTTRLLRNNPSNYRLRFEHATTMHSLGQSELAIGKRDQARQSIQQAVDHLEAVCRLHGSPPYRSSLATALDDLASLATQSNETQLAASLLDRAIEHQQAALTADPDDAGLQKALGRLQQTRNGLRQYP